MSDFELSTRTTFAREYQDPENTTRATSMLQCVRITPNIESLVFVYEVGNSVVNSARTHRIKNLTTNAVLKIEIETAPYVKITPSKIFTLNPGGETDIVISLDNDETFDLVFTKKRRFEDNFQIVISLNEEINEPIYVAN